MAESGRKSARRHLWVWSCPPDSPVRFGPDAQGGAEVGRYAAAPFRE